MNILFLCTGNSCRSQIAEGWARHLSNNCHQVQSAGIESHGKNPFAITVMQEVGIDISCQESTQLTDDMLTSIDYLVTVCGHADKHCPVLSSAIRKEHWPLDDPARATGSNKYIMKVFRDSRDDIKTHIMDLFERLEKENER